MAEYQLLKIFFLGLKKLKDRLKMFYKDSFSSIDKTSLSAIYFLSAVMSHAVDCFLNMLGIVEWPTEKV